MPKPEIWLLLIAGGHYRHVRTTWDTHGMDTPLLGFSHLQLRVRDVETSREWYSTVLGVETMTAADDGSYVALGQTPSADSSYVALRHRPSHMVIVISSRVDGSADGEATVPLDHMAFAVPDGD